MGVIYLDDLGQVKKAVELLKWRLSQSKLVTLAHYNLARSMTIKGNKIEAARLYQVALELNSYSNELDNNEIKARIDNLFN
ncbi:MAG: hypothetical protein MZV64_27790 [Ignavibacteriales bacterium]|nr:hypothetical protein [Ignavibacteriales bacterium]